MNRVLAPLLSVTLLLSACAGPSLPFNQGDPSVVPIQQAYNALIENYIDPPDSVALLQAAYQGALQVLTSAGVRDVELRPPNLVAGKSDNLDQFLSAYKQITDKYASKVHSDRLEYGVISQMAASLKDCQTNFFDPAAYVQQQSQQTFSGIGVILKNIPDHPTILRVLDGPAQRAGLRPGDEILAVDGQPTAGQPFPVLRNRVRGPQGSTVTIKVSRLGVTEPMNFQINRDQVQAPIIEAAVIGGNTGYIHIYSFPPSMLAELDNALAVFDQRGVRSIILDLRANTGGDQQTVLSAASHFVQGSTVEIQVDRAGKRMPFQADPAFYWKQPKPIALLADDDTTAGGEIFVKAFQEAGVGPVVGAQTAGCATTAHTFELTDGSALDISIGKVLSGKGAEINHVGITPDTAVDYPVNDLAQGNDPQLLAAFQKLQPAGTLPATPSLSLPPNPPTSPTQPSVTRSAAPSARPSSAQGGGTNVIK